MFRQGNVIAPYVRLVHYLQAWKRAAVWVLPVPARGYVRLGTMLFPGGSQCQNYDLTDKARRLGL